MGKLIVSSFISIDGFVSAPNDELVPPPPTPDLFRHFIEPNLACGAFLYGRITYAGIRRAWQSGARSRRIATAGTGR